MADKDVEQALKLFVVMGRCFNSITELARRDVDRHGLTGSEFGVLELLYHKGPTPLGNVAGKLLLTSGSITYVVDQLEEKGLVRRRACPTDRRRLYAELTDRGQELIAGIFPEHARVIRDAVAGLSADEQLLLTDLLRRLGHYAADLSDGRNRTAE